MHLVHNWMYFGDATCNQNVSWRVSVHVHCKSNDDCVGCKNGYLVMDIRKFSSVTNGGAMLVTRAVAMHHRFDATNKSKASKSCCCIATQIDATKKQSFFKALANVARLSLQEQFAFTTQKMPTKSKAPTLSP